jgi:hypothetical protein
VIFLNAKQLEEALFLQFEQDVTEKRAAARRLNERQRLEEVEHGNEEID